MKDLLDQLEPWAAGADALVAFRDRLRLPGETGYPANMNGTDRTAGEALRLTTAMFDLAVESLS